MKLTIDWKMENIAKHVFERKNGQGLCLARCANNETSAKRSCNRSNCPTPLILRCVSTIFTETNRSLSPIFSKKKKRNRRNEESISLNLKPEINAIMDGSLEERAQVQRVNLRPCHATRLHLTRLYNILDWIRVTSTRWFSVSGSTETGEIFLLRLKRAVLPLLAFLPPPKIEPSETILQTFSPYVYKFSRPI